MPIFSPEDWSFMALRFLLMGWSLEEGVWRERVKRPQSAPDLCWSKLLSWSCPWSGKIQPALPPSLWDSPFDQNITPPLLEGCQQRNRALWLFIMHLYIIQKEKFPLQMTLPVACFLFCVATISSHHFLPTAFIQHTVKRLSVGSLSCRENGSQVRLGLVGS